MGWVYKDKGWLLMDRVVQKIRVEGNDKDGYVTVIQTLPFSTLEYRYDVPVEVLDAFIVELDERFKTTINDVLNNIIKKEKR